MRQRVLYTFSTKPIHKANETDIYNGWFHRWVDHQGKKREDTVALIETSEGRILQISSKHFKFIETPKSPSPGDLLRVELKMNALVCKMNGMIAENRRYVHDKHPPKYLMIDFNPLSEKFEELTEEY